MHKARTYRPLPNNYLIIKCKSRKILLIRKKKKKFIYFPNTFLPQENS